MSEPRPHPPVGVRDAATVVLLRDGDEGLKVWLMTRVRQMAFAAGMSVFPGGRVDPDDADLPLTGSSLPSVLDRLGGDSPAARALVAAAVRETFEETGVLLTDPAAELAGFRAAVETHELAFAELLLRHGLTIDADAVAPWARWVTPEGEARRYDTRFFVAGLPDGAHAVTGTTEAAAGGWIPVRTALAEVEAGERLMLPPTVVTTAALARYSTVAEVFAAAASRSMDPVEPTLRVEGDRVFADLGDGTSLPVPRVMLR